jgi:hypothetical protein
MHDWESCDGYVKDVETALIAMALSSLVSVLLIIFIERAKLMFYQASEKSYDKVESNQRKNNKYL